MVSPVENLTRLDGTVLARVPHPRLEGWDAVTVDVQHAEAVAGPSSLAQARGGGPLTIAVRRDLLGDAGPGSELTARVKFTPDDLIAEPFPQPGDFSVVPSSSVGVGRGSGVGSGGPDAGSDIDADVGSIDLPGRPGAFLPDAPGAFDLPTDNPPPRRPRRADGVEGPQL